MNILFVSPWYPDPLDNGAKLRIANLLSALCSRHRVTLIAAHDPAVTPPPIVRQPLSRCERVIPIPLERQPVLGPHRLLSYLWSRPEWVFPAPSQDLRTAVEEQMQTHHYDLLVCFELGCTRYVPPETPVPLIVEDVELAGYLGSPETEGHLRRARRQVFAWKLRRASRSLLRRVSACTVPSAVECELLRRFVPRAPQVEIIPNCIDGGRYQGIKVDPQPQTVIFTGGLTFQANRDALQFFLEQVYPLIKRRVPEVRFCITGRHDGAPVPLVAHDRSVRLTGLVADVRPLIAESWLSIAPLLTGGGTRFKILEAMALGTPVVSTSKGAEGLLAAPDEHLLVADHPEDFAAAVVRLCYDRALRNRLSEAGRDLVAEHYTWRSVAPRYLAWVERIALEDVAQVD